MNIVLLVVSFAACFGVAYMLVGWFLAFLVVSQSALIYYAALVIFAAITMAIVSHGEHANRWWMVMIMAIIFCVGLEKLEPYVGTVRVVLAAIAAIWATFILNQQVIRRITRARNNGNGNP